MDLNSLFNKKILITGGNGYIAYNLIDALKDIPVEITRFDLKTDPWSCFDMHAATIRTVDGDIRSRKTLEEILPSHDLIFHFAAQTSVYVADNDPVADFGINVTPLVTMLDICDKKKLNPTLMFSGTATVAGLDAKIPVNESHKINPVTMYDLHKVVAENYLNYYCRKGIIKGATLRLANVYGPGPSSSSKDRGIVNMMVRKALNNDPLTLYGSGEFIRDYVFITDVVKAFLSAAIHIDNVNGQFMYIGTGTGYTIRDLFGIIADKAFNFTGIRPEIKHVDPPENLSVIEYRNFIADNSLIVSQTQWKPLVDLEKGIENTMAHFFNNK
jgi:nucleoside-diphosphate-sugar epimerase